MHNSDNILLFDGVCVLCNGSIKFLIKRDKKQIFRYASLQSDFARQRLKTLNAPDILPDSIIYVRNDKLHLKSDAVLYVVRDLGRLWVLLFPLILIPRLMRDFLYDFVAKHRYKWFGKKDSCLIPDESVRELFIEI